MYDYGYKLKAEDEDEGNESTENILGCMCSLNSGTVFY